MSFPLVEQPKPLWYPGSAGVSFAADEITAAVRRIAEPLYVVSSPRHPRPGAGLGGRLCDTGAGEYSVTGILPPLLPEALGDSSFGEVHGVRLPYVGGEMANGIATTSMVAALARAGMLGFFGAGGLTPAVIDEAMLTLSRTSAGLTNWGTNLIHSPGQPAWEDRLADIVIERGVPAVCASAFVQLTPAVIRCAARGLRVDQMGRIRRPRQVFGKVSRPEVAENFLSPAPRDILDALVAQGRLTPEEARLASRIPVAEDITVEGDSGGHTDNRPLGVMLPTILAVRDRIARREGYDRHIRVGAAGGLGTPQAIAGAFALGAAYVVTGSVNQLALESGISPAARALLAEATEADVAMAPAADMFEQGAKVQVLSRGTMFAPRAGRLYEAYRSYPSLEAIPDAVRAGLESQVLRATFGEVWRQTRDYWNARDPAQIVRADRDPRHRMALTFRWYLGRASGWAIAGDTERRTDYQIWAGPAVGAFNRWTGGSFLADPQQRTVAEIGRNLMTGAAVVTRMYQARTCGLPVTADAFGFVPERHDR